jgi:hypothetical protein
MPADQYNVGRKFQSTISHNVAGFSVMTTTVPSLLPYMLDINGSQMLSRPLTKTSFLYCVDCHDNNQARSNGGTGPNGPHASTFTHLLGFNLYQDPGNGGGMGTSPNALCYRCHSQTTLVNEPVHNKHVPLTGCTTCHDPHGVIGGTARSNLAIVNLDTLVAKKVTTATYYGYYPTSATTFGCYLVCHGETHNPYTYPN